MKKLIYFLSMLVIAACSIDKNSREKVKDINDTTFFELKDSSQQFVKIQKWVNDGRVVEAKYFSSEGQLIFHSVQKNKSVNVFLDSAKIWIQIDNQNFKFLSASFEEQPFKDDFVLFMEGIRPSMGYGVPIDYSDQQMPIKGVIFDCDFENINDSLVRIIGHHDYFEINESID